MNITPISEADLAFTLTNNSEVTERVFSVDDGTNTHTVLVHIDKRQADIDGDGTIDQIDGKFTFTLIDDSGNELLESGKSARICEVHSVTMQSLNEGTTDITTWVADVVAKTIPNVIRKKAALAAWSAL